MDNKIKQERGKTRRSENSASTAAVRRKRAVSCFEPRRSIALVCLRICKWRLSSVTLKSQDSLEAIPGMLMPTIRVQQQTAVVVLRVYTRYIRVFVIYSAMFVARMIAPRAQIVSYSRQGSTAAAVEEQVAGKYMYTSTCVSTKLIKYCYLETAETAVAARHAQQQYHSQQTLQQGLLGERVGKIVKLMICIYLLETHNFDRVKTPVQQLVDKKEKKTLHHAACSFVYHTRPPASCR